MTVHSEAARTGATPSALSNTAPRPSRSTPAWSRSGSTRATNRRETRPSCVP